MPEEVTDFFQAQPNAVEGVCIGQHSGLELETGERGHGDGAGGATAPTAGLVCTLTPQHTKHTLLCLILPDTGDNYCVSIMVVTHFMLRLTNKLEI